MKQLINMSISNEIIEDYRTTEHIKALCKMYPNNQELGAQIRKEYAANRKVHSNRTGRRTD